MSVPVELDELRARINEFGELAHLISVGDDASPHVVSVLVVVDGDRLVVGAGRRTASNVARHATVTLLWSPMGAGRYSLIVDGIGRVGEARDGTTVLTIEPAQAVLHRVAGAAGDGPGCVPVLSPGSDV